MVRCYLCGRKIEASKRTYPDKKYICRGCYFRDMLKKKLKIWH